MNEVLIFAGTLEGRKLSEYLAAAEISHTICVATEYGETVLNESPYRNVHRGRMNLKEIASFLKNNSFAAVIDATHPYARDITRNIKAAAEEMKQYGKELPYLRLKRDCTVINGNGSFTYFETNEACEQALEHTEGNILLTTGSKELACYCVSEEVKRRLYVRVLPSMESLALCMEQGIRGKQILAMQGPFCTELNEAILRQYQISYLVTKESGAAGGYLEKLTAAERTGAQVFVIGCPQEEEGYSFAKICRQLEKICGSKIFAVPSVCNCPEQNSGADIEIILAGIGMGKESGMTKEAAQAVCEADILLGAKRMLANLQPKPEKHPYYLAEQILPYLQQLQKKNQKIVILFSGDSGFYSGCQHLYEQLRKEIHQQRLKASIRILPGISSVAYLASCLGESYEDAAIYSMHGKKLCNLARRIRNHTKTFLLTSGVADMNRLGQQLTEAGLTACEILTGYQLSYDEQQIRSYSPSECCSLTTEGLYTCLVKNPYAEKRKLTHGMADDFFIRGRVPMTKEEVREVSICKLRLQEHAVVYDIGSGTGSVAVEIASLSDDIQVYAVEQKKEAAALIRKNKEKLQLENITVVEAKAPEGLADLAAATHAFIGGSGGRLKEILSALYQIYPKMRVVINAISMETICEIREILEMFPVRGGEIVQIRADRVKQAGNYHLLQSENPVWICAFYFKMAGEDGDEKDSNCRAKERERENRSGLCTAAGIKKQWMEDSFL